MAYFGEVVGIKEGDKFSGLPQAAESGLIANPYKGISSGSDELGNYGADAIVLNGGYKYDRDYGETIVYTGDGGNKTGSLEIVEDQKLEAELMKLMQDEDVTKKSGIYPYVLTRQQKSLNIRAFTDNMKREAFERQKGICPWCKARFALNEMEADHITPWNDGGKTIATNCQMLCKDCNRRKSNT